VEYKALRFSDKACRKAQGGSMGCVVGVRQEESAQVIRPIELGRCDIVR